MERTLIHKLQAWKRSNNRKPLLLQGTRQVGKTWLMKEFGKREFEDVIYLNFESNHRLQNIFLQDFSISRIIESIEIESNQKINSNHTLLIFDEIQEAEKGITSLKYFCEYEIPYYIIAAGSLLGVAMQQKHSFPAGKVDFLTLYPLSFIEFLQNSNNELLAEKIMLNDWNTLQSFHEKMIELLRLYYYLGGMPEVVSSYIENRDLTLVRKIQKNIITGYENDFAKYAPYTIVPKIKMVWQSLIAQLAKENRKFMYGKIKKGARAKDFELAIAWLVDAGLLLKVTLVKVPTIPLKAYAEFDSFKLFLCDIGLLYALGNIDAKIILEKNAILKEYKGAATEQYVCQQLIMKHELYYWTNNQATAEIDLLLQIKETIIPIEVKAEENLKSKSLKVFVEKYDNLQAIRTSMSQYRKELWLTNIPLYAIGEFKE